MRHLISKLFILLTVFCFSSCSGQTNNSTKSKQIIGGPCEGCEAIFEYGSKKLSPTDTLPDFEQSEPKLKLTGTVFKKDGKTPAENVILYVYQTDRNGIYATKGNEKDWAKRHGYIRGWIKTDKTGKYNIYTFRPSPYPNGKESAHIHLTVKEANKNEYYMDSFVFDNDPLLTQQKRNELENRGGNGIVKLTIKDDILTGNRDIILGLNIPNYE